MNSRIQPRMNSSIDSSNDASNDSSSRQTMTTPNVVEVAPSVEPQGLRMRLARNPEWFTVALIVVTCLIVGAINPRFFQFATLFDLLHSARPASSKRVMSPCHSPPATSPDVREGVRGR